MSRRSLACAAVAVIGALTISVVVALVTTGDGPHEPEARPLVADVFPATSDESIEVSSSGGVTERLDRAGVSMWHPVLVGAHLVRTETALTGFRDLKSTTVWVGPGGDLDEVFAAAQQQIPGKGMDLIRQKDESDRAIGRLLTAEWRANSIWTLADTGYETLEIMVYSGDNYPPTSGSAGIVAVQISTYIPAPENPDIPSRLNELLSSAVMPRIPPGGELQKWRLAEGFDLLEAGTASQLPDLYWVADWLLTTDRWEIDAVAAFVCGSRSTTRREFSGVIRYYCRVDEHDVFLLARESPEGIEVHAALDRYHNDELSDS